MSEQQQFSQPQFTPQPPPQAPPLQQAPPQAARRQKAGVGWYSNGKRLFYGSLWAFWTVVFTIAGFIGLSGAGVFPGLVLLVAAFFAGRYDYKIWTWKARRLWFLILF